MFCLDSNDNTMNRIVLLKKTKQNKTKPKKKKKPKQNKTKQKQKKTNKTNKQTNKQKKNM